MLGHLGAIGALAALTVFSAATLTVPFALRRMIDFGFSKDSGGAIDIYFLMVAAPWWSSPWRRRRATISSPPSASAWSRICAGMYSPI